MKLAKLYNIGKESWRLTNSKFTDSRKRAYAITFTGAVVRISPERPWRGKSERRSVIKQRRIERIGDAT